MSKFKTNLLNCFEKINLSEKTSCFSILGEAAKGEWEEKKLQGPVLKGPYFKKVQITVLLLPCSAAQLTQPFCFYDVILIILIF